MAYFWNQLETYSDNIALISETETISYSKLSQIADSISTNIPTRSLVFLVCKNEIPSVAGYVAFLRKNIVTVLLSSSIDKTLFENLRNIYKPQFIWCPDGFLKEKEIYNYSGYKLISTENNKPETNEQLAVLVTTSGSTGSPKLIRLSYENLQSNTQSITEYLGILPSDRAITSLPMNYVYGLSIIQTHLMVGAGIIMTEKSVFDGAFWNLFKSKEASAFSAIPYTYQMLNKLHFPPADLPSLRYITQAGGKLGRDLHYNVAQNLHDHGKKLYVMYGASEATARMSYVPPSDTIAKAGSIGIAIPGGRFELVDLDGNIISEVNKTGELVYYGKNVMMGYAESREDLSRGDEMNGRLQTGDLAKKDEDGFFYIVGRKNRFVKIYGNRVNLSEIEELINKKGYDAVCVGEDDNIRIYSTSNNYYKIPGYISRITHLPLNVFSAHYISKIPRNQAGKVLYSELENIDI